VKDFATEQAVTTPVSLMANSRWNIIAFGSTLASNLVTVPFVVRWIGIDAFGQAGLVLAICAPLVLIGTVLGQALVRERSSRFGVGDTEGAQRLLDAALRLCLVVSALGWLTLVVTGPWITTLLLGKGTAASLQPAFLIAATGWFFQQFGLVLHAASAARQDYRSIARVAVLSAAVNVIAVLGLTSAVPAVEGYLAGIATGLGLSVAAWLWVLRREIKIAPTDRVAELKALLHFAKWQGVAQLAGTIGNQIDRYALSVLAPLAVIGQYNVANRLQEAAYIGAIKSGEVLFPRFGSLSHRGVKEQGELFQTASWVVGTISAMLLVPLVPLSDALLALWVGTDVAQGAAVLLRTLALGGIVGSGSNVFTYYALGTGRNAPVALVAVLYSAITIVFTVVLIGLFGPFAAGAGLIVASVARVGTALVLTRRDFFPHLSCSELAVSTLVPLTAGTLVAVGTHVIGIGRVNSWIHLVAVYIAVSSAVLAATLMFSLLSGAGRAIVSGVIGSLRPEAGR
jgi:O-antigen/teichoic acid export membrane protein